MTVSTTFSLTKKQFPKYTGSALESAIVRVFSEDGETFITQGTTDSSGELVLELPDLTTYWVRFFLETYSFDSKLTIDVDSGAASNTFDVEGQYLMEFPPSASNYLCRASGYVRGADWAPKAGIRMTFSLTGKPRVVGGQVMVTSDLAVVSGADGWIEAELVRNGTYDVVVAGMDDEVLRVQVPDSDSCSITDLIWPYVAALTWSADVEVAAGESQTVTATLTLSSGTTTPFTMDNDDLFLARTFLMFTVGDEAVAGFEWSDTDTVTVTGVTAGTTTISATLNEDVEADREPSPTRSLASLSITVT